MPFDLFGIFISLYEFESSLEKIYNEMLEHVFRKQTIC